jgi:hypothetical protein
MRLIAVSLHPSPLFAAVFSAVAKVSCSHCHPPGRPPASQGLGIPVRSFCSRKRAVPSGAWDLGIWSAQPDVTRNE